ncbi:MAG: AAA family ATPase [Chitinivibrionales bacterium]|nr:AAA family ATPase [Chitinivibrionales bacterium]
MAKAIAVCNQKGGVGKTTTAVNLAACLAAAEHRTLLVDMDPQSNATTGVGIDKHDLDLSTYDVITERKRKGVQIQISDIVKRSTLIQYLDVAPASPDLAGAEIELVNHMTREKKLAQALDRARGQYEYVIIDAPPSLGLLTINTLACADSVLIPIQCEYYALEGLAELLNTIRLVQKNLNPRLIIMGALLTMYDGRLNLCRQVAEDVKACFSGKVFQTAIVRNVKLSEAPSFGKPIILYDIMSAGAENYLNLAKEIMHDE